MFKRHRPAAPAPAHGALSLRLHLLRALATPLFGLVVGTGALSYWLAAHYTAQVFDRALVGVANTLAEQMRLAGPHVPPARLYDIALTAQTLVQNSGEDRIFWRIAGPAGTLIGRDTALGYGSGQVRIGEARVFYSWIDGKQVRAVRLPVPGVTADVPKPVSPRQPAPPDPEDDVTRPALAPTQAQTAPAFNPSKPPDAMQPDNSIVVEVAELLDHRDAAAKEVLLSVSIPLIVLLAVGGLILSLVLKEELQPLQTLADTLNRQSAQSVRPLPAESAERVPAELQPLINAMNALLARLRDALEAQRTFIADAAHQLRTPLTALKLHADHAVQATTLEDARPALLELQSGANRAIRLSNQLLTLARAEPGMTLEQLGPPVRVDLVSLAFDAGAEWVPRACARARPGLRGLARGSHVARFIAGPRAGQRGAAARSDQQPHRQRYQVRADRRAHHLARGHGSGCVLALVGCGQRGRQRAGHSAGAARRGVPALLPWRRGSPPRAATRQRPGPGHRARHRAPARRPCCH